MGCGGEAPSAEGLLVPCVECAGCQLGSPVNHLVRMSRCYHRLFIMKHAQWYWNPAGPVVYMLSFSLVPPPLKTRFLCFRKTDSWPKICWGDPFLLLWAHAAEKVDVPLSVAFLCGAAHVLTLGHETSKRSQLTRDRSSSVILKGERRQQRPASLLCFVPVWSCTFPWRWEFIDLDFLPSLKAQKQSNCEVCFS